MLEKTCKDREFFDAFKELKHDQDLCLPNNNKLKMYYTRIMNNKFDYTALYKLLTDNITNYVFSRKENLRAKEKEEIPTLTIKALKKFREIKNNKDSGAGGELGEFILYIFLESILNAFKILSKMEIKTNSSDYVKGANGIYLYEYKDEENKKHFEYIIGEAKIERSSSSAISDAIESILVNFKNENFEIELVNREILKETFDEETVDLIRKILIPTQDEEDLDIQKGFGIFIGYEINNSKLDNISNQEGKVVIEKQMKEDIEKICENIKKKIKEKKLSNYSFYVFVMPFMDGHMAELESVLEKRLIKLCSDES